MSWSIIVTAGPSENFGSACDEAVQAWRDGNPEASQETQEQISASASAAKAIVDGGCVGAGWVNATLSGHSNPGHEVQEGIGERA